MNKPAKHQTTVSLQQSYDLRLGDQERPSVVLKEIVKAAGKGKGRVNPDIFGRERVAKALYAAIYLLENLKGPTFLISSQQDQYETEYKSKELAEFLKMLNFCIGRTKGIIKLDAQDFDKFMTAVRIINAYDNGNVEYITTQGLVNRIISEMNELKANNSNALQFQ